MAGHYLSNKNWKKKNPEAWRQQKNRNYERGAIYNCNSRARWSQAEAKKIIDPERPHDRALAKEIGRTVRAIQGKRYVLINKVKF